LHSGRFAQPYISLSSWGISSDDMDCPAIANESVRDSGLMVAMIGGASRPIQTPFCAMETVVSMSEVGGQWIASSSIEISSSSASLPARVSEKVRRHLSVDLECHDLGL